MNKPTTKTARTRNTYDSLAGIQYAGIPGCTQDCLNAVIGLLQYGANIQKAWILSSSNDHCFLLTIDPGDLIAIKSGFSSGYLGEGPHGFSLALCLLDAHNVEIEEFVVESEVIERLDNSALTSKDIQKLESAHPRRPTRWSDYVFESDWVDGEEGKLWRDCPPVIPYAIIDFRIFDLAKSFWEASDERLLTGYRRLEDIVRKRTGVDDHGAGLFSTVFHGNPPRLCWDKVSVSEQKGRAQLFAAAFMAFRNPRAHGELERDSGDLLSEFLLLNQLYCLERVALEALEFSDEADVV